MSGLPEGESVSEVEEIPLLIALEGISVEENSPKTQESVAVVGLGPVISFCSFSMELPNPAGLSEVVGLPSPAGLSVITAAPVPSSVDIPQCSGWLPACPVPAFAAASACSRLLSFSQSGIRSFT